MRLQILFFGVLRDRFGEREELEQFPGGTVGDLLRYYRVIAPEIAPMWETIAVAINQQYAQATETLTDGDEIALLPPVSGGAPGEKGSGMQVELTRDVVDTQAIVEALKQGTDGAVTVFDGIVRDNTRGRRTLHLDYTAHEAMALREMEKLADEAVARFGVRSVALVHRLGKLEIGETSVLIAVASAHRGVTFDACRWLIDTLKKTVPIYKKEIFEDGAEWGHGEPFPPELVAHS